MDPKSPVGEPPPFAARKRKAKRKLVARPAPDAPGQVVSELVSVVKVSLASVVRRADFRALAHVKGCDRKRTRARWCADHYQPQFRYDVCYSNQKSQDQHQHRMWNRDVVGALNIGCLFLAQALGLDAALWRRGTTAATDGSPKGTPTSPLPWAEIFGRAGHALPFSLPAALPPAHCA